MKHEYNTNPPLSYNKYLRVPELIDLQLCLSHPAQHDELLFITIHQAYELWFKQILHEIDAAIELMNQNHLPSATRALRRIGDIEKLLVNQIHILESMTPISFLSFRERLNPASGFQSMQFREIEFASGLKQPEILKAFRDDDFAYQRLRRRYESPTLSDNFYAALGRRGFDATLDNPQLETGERKASYDRRTKAILAIYAHFEQYYEEFQLAEALLEHDEFFALWRSHH